MMMLWLSCLLIGSITCRTIGKPFESQSPAAAPAVQSLPAPLPGFLWGSGRVGSSSPGSSSAASQPSAHVYSSAGPSILRDASHSSSHGGSALGGSYGGYGPSAAGGRYGGSASGYGSSAAGGSYGGYGPSAAGGSYGGYGPSAAGGSYGGSASGHGGSALGGSYGGYGPSAAGGSYGGSASGYGSSAPGGSYGGGYGGSAGASYGHVAAYDESSGAAIGTGASTENPEPVFSDVSDLEPVYSYSSRSSYQRGQSLLAQTRYIPEEPVPFLLPSSKAAPRPSAPAKAPAKGGF